MLYGMGCDVAADVVVTSFDLLLRGGEYATLMPSLVFDNSDGGIAVVLDRSKTGKNQGVVAMCEKAKTILRKRKQQAAASNSSLLFPISKEEYASALALACDRLGMARVTPHVFRHSGATIFAAPVPVGRGFSEADLALRGRWVAVKSVARYYKPADLVKAQALDSAATKTRGELFWAKRVLTF
jgi:integrase